MRLLLRAIALQLLNAQQRLLMSLADSHVEFLLKNPTKPFLLSGLLVATGLSIR